MNEAMADISRHVWETKYRYARERSMTDSRRRIAGALAAVEPNDPVGWEARFLRILQDFKFLPGGRIQAGAGTARNVTLFNCFVMGPIEDSIPGIFKALQEGAVTMQQGGGIGLDFSTQQPGQLRRFNLSIQVTDAFVAAVRSDAEWPLVYPAAVFDGDGETVWREWPGEARAVACRVIRRVRAQKLWDRILQATYDYSEPGVLFIDRINQLNNLWYRERIAATNPCGEIPLPPYGACDLGSLNLTYFVRSPFTPEARIDFKGLADTTQIAVRLLDNVIDASRFPLPEQADNAHRSRRIGLGITGLADALVMLGLTYGSDRSISVAAEIMRCVCYAAYRASIALAKEKAGFPYFERDKYLQSPFIRSLPQDIHEGVSEYGIRNSHLIAIAPTGTISLLAGNVSSGLEPIFAASYNRKVLVEDGTAKDFVLTDYALRRWRESRGQTKRLPDGFVTASELPVRAHIAMQAALQPFVDNSISKTINVPSNCHFGEFKRIYDLAYDQGLKGCTTFRPNPITGTVLSEEAAGVEAPHCCVLEREAD
jgi:ribonucleoside-diphosphate reductase alpha chain